MNIVDLLMDNQHAVTETAALLVEAFPQAWPTMVAALEEVQESFGADRISRVAVDEYGGVLGWIGGVRQYNGNVWELHPLVVKKNERGKRIGCQLVSDFEARVQAQGGHIVWLGSDDEHEQTSLAGTDLFPNVCEHIATIENIRRHPYEFYQKLGYVIVGILPDANGPGKPDIFMAKRIP